ncbi:MAG: tyrosine-type recombinase/integrase [Rectinemataceae bacterium]
MIPSEEVTYRLYLRKKGSQRVFYARFIDISSGKIFYTATLDITISGQEPKKYEHTEAERRAFRMLDSPKLLAKLKRARTGTGDYSFVETRRKQSVLEFVHYFWSDESRYLQNRKDRGGTMSEGTLTARRSNIEKYISLYSPFKVLSIADIEIATFDDFKEYLRGLHTSDNIIHTILKQTLIPATSWAQRQGIIDAKFDSKDIAIPVATYNPRGILTISEVDKIIQYSPIGKTERQVRLAALLGHHCGLRRGEIRGLRWLNVHFPERYIFICENYVRYDGMKAPKTKKSNDSNARKVPISNAVNLALLDAFQRRTGDDAGYVLEGDSGDSVKQPVHFNTLEQGYTGLLLSIGISKEQKKERHLTFHGARHFAASYLGERIGISAAMKILGHKTPATFWKYGDKTSDETLDAARNAIDSSENITLIGKTIIE